MSHSRKMVLIEPESLERLQQPLSTPHGDSVSRLDHRMDTIMSSTGLPDFEKWKLYNDQMQKFFQKMDQNRQPIEINVRDQVKGNFGLDSSGVDSMRALTLGSIPKMFQAKAGILYDRLKASGVVTWDDKGVTSLNGVPLPRSNITDLISDALRARKSFNPTGALEFMRTLRELNLPLDLIGNTLRWNAANSRSPSQASSQDTSFHSTPRRGRRRSPRKRHQSGKGSFRWETL